MASQWWQAPVYFTVSLVLAFLAISTALHSLGKDDSVPMKPFTPPLSLKASRALRRSGFNIAATLLQLSPEIFLSSPNSTIFAIKDSAISNLSFPPWLLKHLFQYHTSPLKLSMNELLKKRPGSCVPTLLHGKNVVITKVVRTERLVEINRVLVSHPDLFLEGFLSIHGVLGPFSSLDPRDVHQGWENIHSPICDSNSSLVSYADEPQDTVEWTQMIHLLSSNGFVSFAIGLNSVLDGILEYQRNLSAVTVFTPPELSLVSFSPPLLKKVVTLHIVPRRLTYIELASLSQGTSLRTLLPNQVLNITAVNATGGLTVDRIKIIKPDIISSKKFVVHGISQPLKMAGLPSTSR